MVDLGVKYNIIQKSGAWFSYGDMRLGQGRDNVKELISKNPALLEELDGLIRQNLDKVAELSKTGAKKTKVLNVAPTGIDVSADGEDDE